jgi:hypothetical protein
MKKSIIDTCVEIRNLFLTLPVFFQDEVLRDLSSNQKKEIFYLPETIEEKSSLPEEKSFRKYKLPLSGEWFRWPLGSGQNNWRTNNLDPTDSNLIRNYLLWCEHNSLVHCFSDKLIKKFLKEAE